jgi:hypothetical protein
MTILSRRFEKLIKGYYHKKHSLLPVKSSRGICVGSVTILNEGTLKHIEKNGELIYKNIYLNEAAIKVANLLALDQSYNLAENIYKADQDYGKWLADWQHFKNQRIKAQKNLDHDRSDLLEIRYQESKLRAEQAKKRVMSLIDSNK